MNEIKALLRKILVNSYKGWKTTVLALWIGGIGTHKYLNAEMDATLFYQLVVPAVATLLSTKDPEQK